MTDEVEILLVEPNANDAEVASRALRRSHLANRVQVLKDGEEALDFLFASGAHADRKDAGVPRLVLLSLKLPKVDGLEVLRRLKADERTRAIPVVIVFSPRERGLVETHALEVDGYLMKPVTFDKLVSLVAGLGLYWLVLDRARALDPTPAEPLRTPSFPLQDGVREKEVKVLILEDSPTDAELIERQLLKAGLSFAARRVDSREGFARELGAFRPDLILSDYYLPQFDGISALELASQSAPGVPFIIVTASINEETAVQCLKAGAADYVTKQLLVRLGPAVKGALEKKRARLERERAEEALRASEELFRLISENAADLITVVDMDGRRLYRSPSYGVLGEGVTSWPDEVHEDDRARARRFFEDTLATSSGPRTELRLPEKEGGGRIVESAATLVPAEPGRPARVVIVSRDVTERKRAEEALRASEERFRSARKMEALGRLAGGVAHDFNNLLTAILGYTELLLARPRATDDERVDIEEIEKAAKRASALTRQLLAFSRGQMQKTQPLDLNKIVGETENLLHRVIGEDVDFVTTLGRDLGRVNADRGQVEQVILNLVVNARDAMPRGGRLEIETSNVELRDDEPDLELKTKGGSFVALTVRDAGTGMDPETLSHIFEPFFTTKEQGKGTGLGLSTVYGIVKQSGGNIRVESEPGRGSTFRIFLPRIEAAELVEGDATKAAVRSPGKETLLLVEDEEPVRRLLRRVLEKSGYSVLEACHGEHALEVADAHSGTIDLLVTDFVMPRMNGRELVEKIHPVRPDMRVLYVTGYAEDTVLQRGMLETGASLLQKPFSPDTLVRKVRELLDGPSLKETGSWRLREVKARANGGGTKQNGHANGHANGQPNGQAKGNG